MNVKNILKCVAKILELNDEYAYLLDSTVYPSDDVKSEIEKLMLAINMTNNVIASQYVEIVDDSGNKTVICSESINSSTWYSVNGIDFEGGDTTCYETGWKTLTFDLGDYEGQFVTIRFVVYDVGDSIYDTAALIDNVKVGIYK